MIHHKKLPRVERIKELLSYEPASGIFLWRKSQGRQCAGRQAGSVCGNGDIEITIDGQRCKAHRLAWLLCIGQDPGQLQIDHINCVKDDNRIENLRLATNQQNSFNRRHRASSADYKGIWLHPNGRWRARIVFDGRSIHLGYYDTAEQAHEAYATAAAFWHGNYARVT